MRRASLRERLGIAWHSLRDSEQAGLLLRGPLPLWMQNVLEDEALCRDMEVGAVIFEALREHCEARLNVE